MENERTLNRKKNHLKLAQETKKNCCLHDYLLQVHVSLVCWRDSMNGGSGILAVVEGTLLGQCAGDTTTCAQLYKEKTHISLTKL